MLSYEGIFFEDDMVNIIHSLEKEKLARVNDGQNSGFEILLPEELSEYYINFDEQNPDVLKVPHITASLANGAKGF